MDPEFAEIMRGVVAKFEELIAAPLMTYPVTNAVLSGPGVYVFYDAGVARYVGRANNLHQRLKQHQADGSKHNQAGFAARIAKEKCGIVRSYALARTDPLHFSNNQEFHRAFMSAKIAVRGMQFRFVQESDNTRQALLEIYAATVLKTAGNEFDNH
jgi:hypothetical protein